MNFDQAPMLVIWEVTQACDLACVHCRASAQSARHPQELNTAQGFELLDEIKSFGNPLLVFTGGDPLKRPDIYDLIRHSVRIGLRTNVTPSATPLLTEEAIDRFQECGVSRMAISLDGPDAKSHDEFRGVPGTFDRAMLALYHAKKIGLETQFQTTVTRRNMARLPEMAKIAEDVATKMWSLFFLIVTGRALENDDLAAAEYEQVFDFMYELSKTAPFAIKTTEAMHYRRFVAQRMKAEHRSHAGERQGRRGDVAYRGRQRRQGVRVRVAHRRDFSQRVPAHYGRQRTARFTHRRVPEFQPVPLAARRESARRQVRDLRVSEGVRRVARAGLCADGELSGRGSALRVSAAPGGSAGG